MWRFEIKPPVYNLGDEVHIIGHDKLGVVTSFTCEVEVGHTGDRELLRQGEWKYHVKVANEIKTYREHGLQISSKMAQQFKTAVEHKMASDNWDWGGVANELQMEPGEIKNKLPQIEYYPDLALAIVRTLGMDVYNTLKNVGFAVEVKGPKG